MDRLCVEKGVKFTLIFKTQGSKLWAKAPDPAVALTASSAFGVKPARGLQGWWNGK